MKVNSVTNILYFPVIVTQFRERVSPAVSEYDIFLSLLPSLEKESDLLFEITYIPLLFWMFLIYFVHLQYFLFSEIAIIFIVQHFAVGHLIISFRLMVDYHFWYCRVCIYMVVCFSLHFFFFWQICILHHESNTGCH